MDGHQALANSSALARAGITASGPKDPPGGEIERDPTTGEPTGILKESAMDLVRDHIPTPTTDQRYEALRRAMAHANSLGVTSVHDMCGPADLEAFRMADSDGAMTVRVTGYLSVSDWASFADRVVDYPRQSDMFRLAGFKGFMDGSLGSRTAYMSQPYRDATPDMPYPRGQLTAMAESPEAFRRLVQLADGKGVQIAVHAIGDEANHLLLDAYEAARQKSGRHNALHRIEHAQHLQVDDISRFAKLGVVASMQPFHKADDGRYAEKALGAERLAGSYAFRQLLDAGALLCFGSDWPVVTLNPFEGIASAVNATTLNGAVWLPSHSIKLEEALEAYTRSPARAVHRGDRLGTIEKGKLADIVVLEKDPFSLPPTRLSEIRVATTIVAGRVVYSATK
jgi:predicted amidohydrolase YtcJ